MEIKKKIGILTLPLHTNYGGNLQAYALMTALKKMGHDVRLIKRVPPPLSELKQNYTLAKQLIKKYILLKKEEKISFVRYHERKKRMGITRQHTERFINDYISPQTDTYYSSEHLANDIDKYQFDACIVGSDQVWRPKYADGLLPDFFFSFLRKNPAVKKISYAASFGTEDWEFTEKQAEICRKLLKDFAAVSVREDLGVKLCREKFDVTAQQVLDPTMLLGRDDYMKLVHEPPNEKNELFVYLIDNTKDKEDVIKKISSKFGYQTYRIGKISLSDEIAGLKEQPVAPSVERWLKAFSDSKFVITDSFHGCVFCILFNKPFVVYASRARGLSRFTSLMSMFGLENRLIFSSEQLKDNVSDPIDWEKVNRILEEKRAEAFQFLQKTLN